MKLRRHFLWQAPVRQEVPVSEAQFTMIPETRYARSGGVNIAYQAIGNGPRDLVLVPGWVSNIDVFWEEPTMARLLTRLASFSRLISGAPACPTVSATCRASRFAWTTCVR
jgi:hypothetical protein